MEAGVQPKFLRSMMTQALWKAVFYKNLQEVRYLVVDEKVDVNETNPQHNFETPLICATKKGCLDIVKFLVEVGKANVNAKDKDGNTAMITAAFSGDIDIIHYLLQETNASACDYDKHGNTVLMWACSSGDLDIVKYLIERAYCDVHTKALDGQTALMWTVKMDASYLPIVEYLVDVAKADLYEYDLEGKMILEHASDPKIKEFLKSRMEY